MKHKSSKIIITLFVIYAAVMLWLLFFQRTGRNIDTNYADHLKNAINIVPFRTISAYWREASESGSFWAVKNLAGNIVLFIPAGVFLPCLWKKQRKFSAFILTVTALIMCVELIQLFTMLGSCDVDDLIFNVFGASLGYAVWRSIIAKFLFRNTKIGGRL